MEKTISVKGIGFASVKSDYVELGINLNTLDKNYEKAYNSASTKINQLSLEFEKIGFNNNDLKTTYFNVDTDYSSERDKYDNYRKIFNGYNVRHKLKLSFDFDLNKISEVLGIISKSPVKPEINLTFTVKDPSLVEEELLKSASINARKKAEILCSASGVKLGDLLTINYNWQEVQLYSETRYSLEAAPAYNNINFEPDDIDVSDTASFVWEIK